MNNPTHPPAGTPSLKQLVAQATPGPYKSASRKGWNANTVYAQRATEHQDRAIAQIYGIAINRHIEELGLRDAEGFANAQLIARLSPETVLAVYENLYHIAYSNPINPEIYAKVALDLLDGGAS